MKKFHLVLLFLLQLTTLTNQVFAQQPDFLWAKQSMGAGGENIESGRSIIHDAQGNTYVTGYFENSIIFGSTTLSSSGGYDIFTAKYNPSGDLEWAKKAGGAGSDIASSIGLDNAGNFYITGNFTGTAHFGSMMLTSNGNTDVFIAKYDASGNEVWAIKAGGTNAEGSNNITVDGAGNIFITGSYSGTMLIGNSSLTSSNGSNNSFIAKFNASGEVLWARSTEGDNSVQVHGLALDNKGNAYVAGGFYGTSTFGSTVLVSNGNYDIFIAKYSATGSVEWAIRAGGQNYDSADGIAAYGSGNLYVTGSYNGDITFGNILLTRASYKNMFTAKLDAAGNVVWAKGAGGPNIATVNCISVDNAGNSHITGSFFPSLSFGTTTLTSNGQEDIFIATYDPNGNLQIAKSIGGTGGDTAFGISVDNAGNSYITGIFSATLSSGNISLTSSGGRDMFLTKQDVSGNMIWAKSAGGRKAAVFGNSVAVDDNGNSYIAGYFEGAVTFNSTILISSGYYDIFIVKYDAAGNMLWAKKTGGNGAEGVLDIALDKSGNLLVTGFMSGPITLGNTTLTSSGLGDIFVAKYDAGGNVLWAKNAGGPEQDKAQSIAVDGAGNVYITGYIEATALFGNITLSSSGRNDVFIAKYDPSGNVQWAKRAGGASLDYGYGIAVDGSGNCFVTGSFDGSATFGGTTLAANDTDIFLVKFDSEGNELWAKKAGLASTDIAHGIAVDAEGNAYITGRFNSNAMFGDIILYSSGSSDVFIVKYDALGNVLWAKKAGGTSTDVANDITLDAQGNAFVTGFFEGTASFGSTTLTSSGSRDVFVVTYDAAGNVLWAKAAGGVNMEVGNGIVVDGAGNSYLTGYFLDSIMLDSYTLTSFGRETFVAKLNRDILLSERSEIKPEPVFSIYPNPAKEKLQLTLSLPKKVNLEIKLLDAKGRVVLKQNHVQVSDAFHHLLDLKGKVPGIYLIQISTDEELITKRIVKE